jgi:hypothetical protein
MTQLLPRNDRFQNSAIPADFGRAGSILAVLGLLGWAENQFDFARGT